jgi:hypothetical protein
MMYHIHDSKVRRIEELKFRLMHVIFFNMYISKIVFTSFIADLNIKVAHPVVLLLV